MTTPFTVWFGGPTGSHLGFGTHMHVLASAVLQARPGPVLEYGVGFFSTPILHLLCEELGRDLLSLEGDPTWAEKFGGLRTDRHRIIGVSRWEDSEPIVDAVGECAVAFIDHGPDERRVVDARRLAHRAEFVVVHDWADTRDIAGLFEHKWVSRVGPFTAVLSNVRPFSFAYAADGG